MARSVGRLSVALLASCAGPATAPRAPCPGPAPSAVASATLPPAARGARVTVRLRPRFEPDPAVLVEIDAASDDAGLASGPWSLSATAPKMLRDLTANDDAGPLTAVVDAAGSGARVRFHRATRGAVHVAYRVDADARINGAPLTTLVAADRFRGAGEALLLLPDAADDRLVTASVAIDGRALQATAVASSMGIGSPREREVRGRFLRLSSFLAGGLGTAVLDAPEGHDEAAWIGYTAFDVRPVVGELAQVRTGMAEFFRTPAHAEAPMTYLFFAHARPQGSFAASPRAASVIVHLGPSEPWGAPLRMALAQQLVHHWIGGTLWIGPTGQEREAEAYWFTEGVARFVAARLLARFGVLEPTELRDLILAEIAEQATSPERGATNVALAAKRGDPDARALLVARGALYAARVDAMLRARGGAPARSLDDIIRALYKRAAETRDALPTSAWVEAITAELGEGEARAFDALIVRGGDVILPGGALGACFQAGTAAYTRFDLGFDDARTSASGLVTGLRAGGPAARAGLREGDAIERSEYARGRADVAVKLTVKREAATSAITFLPSGDSRRAQTWIRIAGVPDERCR